MLLYRSSVTQVTRTKESHMVTPMIAELALTAACMLSCFTSIAFYNEAMHRTRDWSIFALYGFLILVASVIAVVPVYLVAHMQPPADGNYVIHNWCRWGVGIPLAVSAIITIVYLFAAGDRLERVEDRK